MANVPMKQFLVLGACICLVFGSVAPGVVWACEGAGEELAENEFENETTGGETQKGGEVYKISPKVGTDTTYKDEVTWKKAVDMKKYSLDEPEGKVWGVVTKCGEGEYRVNDICTTRTLIQCKTVGEKLKAIELFEIGVAMFFEATYEGTCLAT
jgi:hypothetical protein